MEQLINMVVEKTGLPADKAQSAVEAVVSFFKEKLPAPLAGQIDNIVEGGESSEGAAGLAQGLTSGLFGNKE